VALASRHKAPSEHWLSSLYSASLPVSGLKALPWRAKKDKQSAGEAAWVAWSARKCGERCGRRRERRCGAVVTIGGGDGVLSERLSVWTVASSGETSSSGTLRPGAGVSEVSSIGTLRAGSGDGEATCLAGPPGGCGLGQEWSTGGSRGALVGWLGLVVPWRTSISVLSASTWLSVNGASGEFGDGFCHAWTMSAMPALM